MNESNASVKTTAPKYAPLMKAAALGDFEKVLDLVQTDVDLFEKDSRGRTALDWARLGRHRDCAETLEHAMRDDIEVRRRQMVAEQQKVSRCVVSRSSLGLHS